MPFWMDNELDQRRQGALYRKRRLLEERRGPRVRILGREFVNFASNDYLNLAGDPRLARAAARAARRWGCGAGASPLVTGYLQPHRSLEKELARWEGVEAAVVFSSGYAANLAAVSSLAEAPDAIFSDELNHASLIDGCRLARAHVHVYRHRDANHLHDLLKAQGGGARRRLIVTDSVFSMDGDLAPMADLRDLAQRHDALLMVDEAHATGVLGRQGRGASELIWPDAGAVGDTLVKVGTLSKALGTQGGFICGQRTLRAWLVNQARPYIYSTGLAPPVAGAARQAVRLAASEGQRRMHLAALGDFCRDRLRALGYPVATWGCQIIPLVVGSARAALRASTVLLKQGLLVPAIRPPTVPVGTARLRISLTAGHSLEDVARLAEALGKL
jgi:8-amino-7-oxononanoate synthase